MPGYIGRGRARRGWTWNEGFGTRPRGKMELQERLLLSLFVVLLAIVGSQYPVLGDLLP